MAKNFRKILATLLALVMLVSVSGIDVLAEEVAEIPRGEEARGETPAAGPRSTTKQTLAQLMAGEDEADYVAEIGDTGYTTLQAAITAAGEGDTITLLRDSVGEVTVWARCTITLDLNGKTVYGAIWNYGKLTITGDGTVDNTGDASGWPAVCSSYDGTPTELTIENGTFKSGSAGVPGCGQGTVHANQADAVNIQGGTFINNSDQDPALLLYECKTDATVSGGAYTTSGNQNAIGVIGSVVTISGITAQGGGMGLAVSGGSDVTIDSGNFSGDYALKVSGASTVTVNGGVFAGTGEGNDVFAVYATGEATVTLNGGTFSSKGAFILLPGAYNSREGTNVTITGGTFTAGELATDSVKDYEPQTLHITGGTFLSDVSDYCADGYEIKTNEDGTYTVVAVNGEKTPVQIAAAQSPCTLGKTCTSQWHFVECPRYIPHDDAAHDYVRHVWSTNYANCEEYGYYSEKCLTCDKYRYTVAEPIEHTYDTLKNPNDSIPATCGEDRQDFYYCTKCKAGETAPKIVFAANTKLPVHNGDGIIPEDGCPECGSPAVAMRVTPDGTVTYHANLKNAVGGFQKVTSTTGVTIAQAEDGSVITLLDDIIENEVYIDSSVTLDLNGHTMDGANQRAADSAITIRAGVVTIQNGVMSNHDTGYAGGPILIDNGANVTVTDMKFIDNRASGSGGAINVSNSTLTVSNCTFTGNTSSDRSHEVGQSGGSGGAIYAQRSTVNIKDCGFIDNVANQYGGAVYLYSCTLGEDFLKDCSIEENKAGGSGGAVFIDTCTLGEGSLNSCSFDKNEAGGSGGAIYFYNHSDLTIGDTTTFTGNQAAWGGAVYFFGQRQDEVVTLGGTYENNSAFEGGAAIAQNVDRLVVPDSAVFTGNQATSDDQATFCCGGAIEFWNTLNADISGTFTKNSTNQDGGALYFSSVQSANISGTFTKNSANQDGGAFYFSSVQSADISGTFTGNSAANRGGAIRVDGVWADQSANISGTFTGNSAGASCGAIFAKGANVTLSNGEITGNTAATYSGGILIQSGSLTVEPTMAIHSNTAGTTADDIRTHQSPLTLPAAAEMGAVLEEDGRPISGWYMDKINARWKDGVEDGTCVEYTPVDGDTTNLYLKAAHGPYCDIVYDLAGGTLGTDKDGNEVTNPTEYEPGFSEFTLNNPTKEGYTFLGWTGSNGEEPEETVSITKETTGDLSYTANWEINEYNVIYKVDGVVIEDLGHKATYNTEVTVAEEYVKAGHTATAWATADADVTDGVFTMPAKDVTLTASTNAIDYTVVYDLAGGKTTSEATSFTQHYGDATATIAEPTRAGYTFQGWDPAVAETVTGNATYTAQWKAIDYTVNYILAGGETTSEATSFTQHYGDATATIADPTRVGYTFQGWSPDVAETVTGNANYTAQWKAIEYNVTYKVDDVVIEGLGHKATYNTEVTVADKYVKDGYTATAWATTDADVTDGTFTMPAKDVTLTASTNAIDYTVTYDLAGGETTSEAISFTQHYGDATATIAEPTRAGYTFQGWDPTVAETVTGNAEYTAQWKKNSSGGGTSRPSRPADEEEIEDPDVPLAGLPVIASGLNNKDHVAYLIGRPDGSIAPLDNITRGEVATIFFRLLTEENRTANWSTSCAYIDMDGTEYFYNPVSTVTKAALVEGYPDGTFSGGNKITRAEMATIAARFLSEAYTGEDLFDDIGGHWAAEYINRAATAGWFKTTNADGTKVGDFRPDDYITRAEVVVMINRMLGRKASMEYLLPDMKIWPDNVYSESSDWYYLDIQEATNSHDYTQEGAGLPEKWTKLNEIPDWAAMERR